MSTPEPEEFFVCPYDSTHMNNPCTNMATCPFNALHLIPKPELRYHVSTCTDKNSIANSIAGDNQDTSGTYFKGCTDNPKPVDYGYEQTEDWDSEINTNKIFVWGESYKYDEAIVGPDDYWTTLSSEKDSYLSQKLREEHNVNILEGSDGTMTRLPKQTPRVLNN